LRLPGIDSDGQIASMRGDGPAQQGRDWLRQPFSPRPTRRLVLAALVGAASLRAPAASAQPPAIRLGSLVPLTGIGAPFGAEISMAQRLVVDEVNAAGGLLGRAVELVVADSQTDPAIAVKAARRLIDTEQVQVVMGSWNSTETNAIAPLCWQARVMLFCLSAADSVTQLPHQGYVARTQPSAALQWRRFAAFALEQDVRHLHAILPQSATADATVALLAEACAAQKVLVSSFVYDPKRSSFHDGVAGMMKTPPQMLVLGGDLPDIAVLALELRRAGYAGKVVGFAHAIGAQLLKRVAPEVAEGFYAIEPVPAIGAPAYLRLQSLIHKSEPGSYACQGYDEANLAILAMAWGKAPTGKGVRDNLRRIGDRQGLVVDNAVDGLRLLAEGKRINYEGASGPCKFDASGDLAEADFRLSVIREGKVEIIRNR
jgi:branched-chain amino acid transport system substrate-binding protein